MCWHPDTSTKNLKLVFVHLIWEKIQFVNQQVHPKLYRSRVLFLRINRFGHQAYIYERALNINERKKALPLQTVYVCACAS